MKTDQKKTNNEIDAMAEAFGRALREVGPILARIAAADTVRTVERTETILSRAIAEGVIAAEILKGVKK